MSNGRNGSDQLLELQRRGLELAAREADERRNEINAVLSSRRLLLAAHEDPNVRDARVAILEELTRTSYPNAMVLAAARHLAGSGRRPLSRLNRLGHRPPRIGRVSKFWRLLASAAWVTALVFLITGIGESAVGAHFTSGVLMVWAVFLAVTGLAGAGWVQGWRRTYVRRSLQHGPLT